MECSLGKAAFTATGCVGAATLGISIKGLVVAATVGSSLVCPIIGVVAGIALVVFSGYRLYKAMEREGAERDPAAVRVLSTFSQPEETQQPEEKPVPLENTFKRHPPRRRPPRCYRAPKVKAREEVAPFRWQDTAAIAASLATLLFIGFLL